MKKYKLFLDDKRVPSDVFNYIKNPIYLDEDWAVVTNYNDFVQVIEERGIPDVISFDHDLADFHYGVQDHLDQDYYNLCEEKTGYHCAQWLLEYCMNNSVDPPMATLIHSMNGPGRLNIQSLFTTYRKVHGK